jgi:hypothetical protein
VAAVVFDDCLGVAGLLGAETSAGESLSSGERLSPRATLEALSAASSPTAQTIGLSVCTFHHRRLGGMGDLGRGRS